MTNTPSVRLTPELAEVAIMNMMHSTVVRRTALPGLRAIADGRDIVKAATDEARDQEELARLRADVAGAKAATPKAEFMFEAEGRN